MHITNKIIKGKTITDIRYTQKCTTLVKFEGKHPECTLKKEILKFPQNSKIGLFTQIPYNTSRIKEIETTYDYKINSLLVEKIHKYNLQDYDYLIFVRGITDSDNITNIGEGITNYSVDGKIIYYKNNKLPQCLYLTSKNILITEKNLSNTIPYKVSCFLPTNILTANNFIQIGEIKLKNTYEDDEKNMVYRIYENKNSKKN